MFLIHEALIFCAFVIVVNGNFRCEPDVNYGMTIFGSGSFYGRQSRNRCFIENVKSPDELSAILKPASAENIASILFVNSSLSSFPDKFFSKLGLKNVRKLDASRLVLSEITPTAFFDSKNWDSIDFSSNQIKALTGRIFATMQIKSLDLSLNYIETIDDVTFTNADVEKLILSDNKLKSIRFVNSFNSFNLLELNANSFEELDKIEVKKDAWTNKRGLFGDPEFPKISLEKNRLRKIDCSSTIRINSLNLEENPQLSQISLNQCQIDNVDASNCPSLTKASINENLKSFTAKNSRLDDIDFSAARQLTTLSLENSSISVALIEKVMKMENLTYLDLSYNNIGALNISTFAKLKNLQVRRKVS